MQIVMDVNYLGHSSFRLKFKSGVVVTDPFDPKVVGLKYPKVTADIITVSHNHGDHNFTENITGVKKIINGPGEYEVSRISIIGIGVFHDNKKGEVRGRNVIYIIEGDGMRIVHLGDLGHKLSEDVLNQLGEVNILMIPVGGFYTIEPNEAVEIVRVIEPNIVIPMHYKVDGMKDDLAKKLQSVDSFLKEVDITTENVDKLSIKANEFTEEQKVLVFRKK